MSEYRTERGENSCAYTEVSVTVLCDICTGFGRSNRYESDCERTDVLSVTRSTRITCEHLPQIFYLQM